MIKETHGIVGIAALLATFSFLSGTVHTCRAGDRITPDRLTPEMIINMKKPSSVAISPNGSQAAYALRVQRGEDEEPGRMHSQIWTVDTASGETRRYTAIPGRSRSPRWSPNGKEIAFLTSRFDEDNTFDVFTIQLDGGEGKRVTDEEESVSSFRWFPDGSRIAYIKREAREEDAEEIEDSGKDWTVVDSIYRQKRLWSVNLISGEKKLLFEDEVTVHDFEISPEGGKIALTAADTPLTDDSFMFKRLFLLDTGKGRLSLLHDPEAKIGKPAWSPDGRHICFNAGVDINDPTEGSLFVKRLKGGPAVNLTPGFAGTVTWTDWFDNERIAFVAVTGAETSLFSIKTDGSGLEKIAGHGPIFTKMSFSTDRQHLAALASTPRHPRDVFYAAIGNPELKRLTSLNPEIEEVRLPQQEVISWNARDGLEIEGILVKPLDYREGELYPLVVKVHGGPEYAYKNGWNTSYFGTYLLASEGFAVLMPNYRGSYGRGVEYSKADHKDLGGKELTDILDGVDFLARAGIIDPGRVGIGGSSYGGYLSALAATRYTENFGAAVVSAGITNWLSFSGTSDIPYENSLVHWNLWAYDEPDLFWERSGIAHIRKVNTPILILHGEEDLRVPISQARELYTALRIQGAEVKFVSYPRAGHGLSEREHQMNFLMRTLNWYRSHL